MGNRRNEELRADLAEARREFEQWRASRRRGTRIPVPLWARATELAGKHGVNRTSQALGLDYYALKERLDGAAESPKPAKAKPRQQRSDAAAVQRDAGRFVELALGAGTPSARCELLLEASCGRMHLSLQGYSGSELGALVREVWRRES